MSLRRFWMRHNRFCPPFVILLSFCLSACTSPMEEENNGGSGPAPLADVGLQGCTVGETMCTDGAQFQCQSNGLWAATGMDDDCAGSEDISCADALASRSYIGCEYWPVDLDNAIEVAPPIPSGPADCQFENASNVWTYYEGLELCVSGQTTAGLCRVGRTCPNGYNCQAAPACILNAQNSNFTVVVSNPST